MSALTSRIYHLLENFEGKHRQSTFSGAGSDITKDLINTEDVATTTDLITKDSKAN